MSLQIITTQDGSNSLFNTELNETYHSVHGAVQESVHVFIKKGLDYLIEEFHPPEINILEIGFGTGLNALLTFQRASEVTIPINYTSLETFPLQEEVWSRLNYSDTLGLKDEFISLHRAAWNEWVPLCEKMRILKMNSKLEDSVLLNSHFNLIYFDAFAPSKQPELWEYSVLEKIKNSMNSNSVFVTYCAKGQLKRDLKALGLKVETISGPPGKKEMVRATL